MWSQDGSNDCGDWGSKRPLSGRGCDVHLTSIVAGLGMYPKIWKKTASVSRYSQFRRDGLYS